ncbi:MAG: isoprenylcysteine carboxylmethyltransferase family protein [Syntrophomonadaceae bacterium]
MENAAISKSKAYIMPTIMMVGLGLVLFLPAGSLSYWQGWVYWTTFLIPTLFITIYFFKRSPELLARRWQGEDQETVKKIPAFFNLFLLAYIIPGFDFRFHWSTVPVWVVVAADLTVFLGYLLIILVFKENSYTSSNITVENEQTVIATGPYAILRHPMYTGLLVMVLFAPLALGSYWGVIPGLLIIPWTVLRIRNEEELLLRELPGYQDYCTKTPYRLIPLVW